MIYFQCALFCAKGLALGAWLGYRKGYANGVRDEATEQEMDERLRAIFDEPTHGCGCDECDSDYETAAICTTISASADIHGASPLPPNYDSRA